jgi:hypothetical protein
MLISFVKAISRKDGKVKTLVEVASVAAGRTDLSKIVKLWGQFQSGEKAGGDLRRQYSSAICCRENSFLPALTFRDADLEQQQVARDAAAREASEAVQAAELALQVVRDAQAAAVAAHADATAKAKAAGIELDSPAMGTASLEERVKGLEKERDEALAKVAASLTPPETTEQSPTPPVAAGVVEGGETTAGVTPPPED